jgi:hypothetical protein
MFEYEITFTLRAATVTVKSSDSAFNDKWWSTFKPVIAPDPIPYPEKPKTKEQENQLN